MHDIGGLEYCHGRTLRIMVWFNFFNEKNCLPHLSKRLLHFNRTCTVPVIRFFSSGFLYICRYQAIHIWGGAYIYFLMLFVKFIIRLGE